MPIATKVQPVLSRREGSSTCVARFRIPSATIRWDTPIVAAIVIRTVAAESQTFRAFFLPCLLGGNSLVSLCLFFLLAPFGLFTLFLRCLLSLS